MTSAERYAKSVFHQLYESGPMTRTALMQALKMRQNSIVDICNRLENSRLILKEDDTRRRNVPLFLNPYRFAVAGIEHAKSQIRCVLLDGASKKIATESFPIDPLLGGEARLQAVFDITAAFLKPFASHYTIIAIGMADIGIVDTAHGIAVYSAHVPDWCNLPLAERLKERFSVFPRLVDRSGASALENFVHHPAKRSLRDSIQVWISNGIGASILHNGRFWGTDVPSACQLGHTVIQPDGERCGCGNRGCLETVASIPAILRRMEAASGRKVASAAELLQLARTGDSAVLSVLSQAATALGVALANTVTFTAVTNVILRSELFEGSSVFLDMVVPVLKKNLIVPFRDLVKISTSTQAPDCSAEGAALFAQREFFSVANTDPIPELSE